MPQHKQAKTALHDSICLFIFTIRADERGAASLRLIAALLLVNRNGVAGESSPCDWVSFNRCSATLTCDPVAINRCSAAFNLSSSQRSCSSTPRFSKSMSHTEFLCLQIATVVFIGCDDDRNIVHDFKSIAFQSHSLDGVVADKEYFADAQFS